MPGDFPDSTVEESAEKPHTESASFLHLVSIRSAASDILVALFVSFDLLWSNQLKIINPPPWSNCCFFVRLLQTYGRRRATCAISVHLYTIFGSRGATIASSYDLCRSSTASSAIDGHFCISLRYLAVVERPAPSSLLLPRPLSLN